MTGPVEPPAQPAGRPTVASRAPAAPSSGGRGYAYGGPAFLGGILVGVGLGILLGDFGAWLLIGIGAGFILMAFIAALGK